MTQTIEPLAIPSGARINPTVLLGGTAVARVALTVQASGSALRRDVSLTPADTGGPLFVGRATGINPDVRAFASVLNTPVTPASNAPVEDPVAHASLPQGPGTSRIAVLLWPATVPASTTSATYVGRGGSVVVL